jgi:hypothetical protein
VPRRASTLPQTPVAGGVLWITTLAVLLAGVVAVNVAVLRLNMRLDELGHDRASLRAENAALESQLSSAAAAPKIEALARRNRLVPAAVENTKFVDVAPRKR